MMEFEYIIYKIKIKRLVILYRVSERFSLRNVLVEGTSGNVSWYPLRVVRAGPARSDCPELLVGTISVRPRLSDC